MHPHNPHKQAESRQIQDIERASWFARLAFGDWAGTPVPAPSEPCRSSFHVLP